MNNSSFIDVSAILNRVKKQFKLKTDTDLAVFLGRAKATLSTWKTRNSLDWELLFAKCEQMDLNFLIKGTQHTPTTEAPPEIRTETKTAPYKEARTKQSDAPRSNTEVDDFKSNVEGIYQLVPPIGDLKRRIRVLEKQLEEERHKSELLQVRLEQTERVVSMLQVVPQAAKEA